MKSIGKYTNKFSYNFIVVLFYIPGLQVKQGIEFSPGITDNSTHTDQHSLLSLLKISLLLSITMSMNIRLT